MKKRKKMGIDKIAAGVKDLAVNTAKNTKLTKKAQAHIAPNGGSARKLAASLDAMASQNRAAAAQDKNELLNLFKLRETLEKHCVRSDALDVKTLRKINSEANKLKDLSIEELAARGCSPTQLFEVSAAEKIIEHPYGPVDEILRNSVARELSNIGIHPVDYTAGEFDRVVKNAKKLGKDFGRKFNRALKKGTPFPTEDPITVAARKFAEIHTPKTQPKAILPEIKTAKKAAEAIDAKTIPAVGPAKKISDAKVSFPTDISVSMPKLEPSSVPAAGKIPYIAEPTLPTAF